MVAGKRLIVADTHLFWRPELSQLKLFQSMMIMRSIQAVKDVYGDLPLFLALDSNSVPGSKVYRYYRFLFVYVVDLTIGIRISTYKVHTKITTIMKSHYSQTSLPDSSAA